METARAWLGILAAGMLGATGGIALWAVTVWALFAAGLSFLAVYAAVPVALVVALIAAPLLYRRTQRRRPALRRPLLAFYIGAIGVLLYFLAALMITDTAL